MLIKKEEFDKLCPSYQAAIQKLEAESAATEDVTTKIRIFQKFMNEYLMRREIMEEFISLTRFALIKYHLFEVVQDCELRNKAKFHFFDNKEGNFCKLVHIIPRERWMRSIPEANIFEAEMESQFICPQRTMERTFRFFEEVSCVPIPKEVVEKFKNAQKLYSKIIEAEGNLEKWFSLITSVKEEEFIINNIEFRLGLELNNIELWHLYIEFLKGYNKKKLLSLYSRYCRYFIDDAKMKKEYEKATKKHGPSIVPWENAFDFETFEKQNFDTPKYQKLPKISSKPLIQFTFRGMVTQSAFSLPKPTIAYIKNAQNPVALHQLHKTCKYFVVAQPHPVCHRLKISSLSNSEVQFFKQQLKMGFYKFLQTSEMVKISIHPKLILAKSLDFSTLQHLNRILLSKALASVHQCFAKYIKICYQNISEAEFDLLVGHGNVEILELSEVNILNKCSLSLVPLEDILKKVPKICEFSIEAPIISQKTNDILPKLKFENKFQEFSLYAIPVHIPFGFPEFVKKNFDSNSRFCGRFVYEKTSIEEAAIESINEEMREFFETCGGQYYNFS